MLRLRSNIKLIALSSNHGERMLKWMKEPSVEQNIGLRREATLEKTLEWIERSRTSDEVFPFAIMIEDAHVGNVILDKVDKYLSMARFSIYIGENTQRGSGIGRTATYQICQFGFESLLLNKIWLTVHTKNFGAINVYSQAGFQLEGVLRDEFIFDNQRLDAFYMGLLRSDFSQLNVNFEENL
jgi:RimJ/RimL family protein N-acetyltransferase